MNRSVYRLLVIILCCRVHCWAGIVVDQSQTGITNGTSFAADSWQGQSFTPSMPWLYAVELKCYSGQYVEGPFSVEIWQWRPTLSGYGSTQDPRVGTAPLANATINAMDANWTPWVRWDFGDGVDLSGFVGQKLLILFRASTTGISCYLDTRNPYSRGDRYWITYTDNSDPNLWYWHYYLNVQDMTFRTFGTQGNPAVCGDPGTEYNGGDINTDCRVDLEDLFLLVSNWLESSISLSLTSP